MVIQNALQSWVQEPFSDVDRNINVAVWTDLNASTNWRIQILPEEETLIFKLPKQDENRLNTILQKGHIIGLRRISTLIKPKTAIFSPFVTVQQYNAIPPN